MSKEFRLHDLGEDALVALLTKGWQRVGDDCAVLSSAKKSERLLFKTDAVVEGAHFLEDTTPESIGSKALSRCVSDIASMGGQPLYAVVTLAAPPEESVARLKAVYRGLEKAARRMGLELVGGETTRNPVLLLSIAMLGTVKVKHLVLRSGARPGDLIFVTGRLGGSIQGKHLHFTPRLEETQWLVSNFKPSAMLDLSDGVARDLPRLCHQSSVGYTLTPEHLPLTPGCTIQQALEDGEDYEMLFTMAASKAAALRKAWPFRLPLTVIGEIVTQSKRKNTNHEPGYDPFRNA